MKSLWIPLVFAVHSLLTGCTPKSVSGKLYFDSLSVSASASKAYVGERIALSVSGGLAPFEYRLISGQATIDQTSHEIVLSNEPETTVVEITDAQGLKGSISVESYRPLSVVGRTQFIMTSRSSDPLHLAAINGVPPLKFSVLQGSGTVNADTGEYQASDTADTTIVQVSDSLSQTASFTISHEFVFADLGVQAMARGSDDQLFLGGKFKRIFPQRAQGAVELSNLSGEMNLQFQTQSGFQGDVYSMLRLPNGQILVGGDFTTYGGVSRNSIAKLNADGSLDLAFDPGVGFDREISAMALVDNQVIVAGGFDTYNNVARAGVAKLDLETGALDTTFNPGVGFGSGSVLTLAYANGSIYAGGDFTTYQSIARRRIVKLNATTAAIDTTFNASTGFNAEVYKIAVDATSVYCVGDFTTYKSATRFGIAKIDATTAALNTSFDPLDGFDSTTTAIVKVGNSLYVGGDFHAYRSTAIIGLAKLSALDASIDLGFTTHVDSGSLIVKDLCANTETLFVAGNISSYNAAPSGSALALSLQDGAPVSGFDSAKGPTGISYTCEATADKVLIGGDFRYAGGFDRRGVVKLKSASLKLDEDFTVGIGFNDEVRDLAYTTEGLYVGGKFTKFQVSTVSRIAKLDNLTGALQTAFAPPTINNTVNALAIKDGFVYAGGAFTSIGGATAGRLGKFNGTTGASVGAFDVNPGFNGAVNNLAISGTSIFAAGAFSTYDALSRNRIAKVNLTTGLNDATFAVGTGFNATTTAVHVSGSSVFVTGSFATFAGSSAFKMAKLNSSTGQLTTSFGAGLVTGFTQRTDALFVSDGNAFLTGAFTAFESRSSIGLIKLSEDTGATQTTYSFSGLATVSTTNFQKLFIDNQRALIVGEFTTAAGVPRCGLVAIDLITGELLP